MSAPVDDLVATLAPAAVAYAEAGWPVFPLRGKDPAIPKRAGGSGFKDATTDPERVAAWWERHPEHNIGAAIPESLAVVDADAKTGGLSTLFKLEESEGLPATLSTLTGGGGLHLWFLHPGGELRQIVSRPEVLGEGIDTRIPGKGYVVLPPSIHPSGTVYEWYDEDADAAPMPRWMVDRLRPEPRPPRRARPRPAGNIGGRLRGVLSVVGPDGPGWNDRLHWAACRAGEMVREDGADPGVLAQALLDAAQPWNDREARAAAATIRSGMTKTGGAA